VGGSWASPIAGWIVPTLAPHRPKRSPTVSTLRSLLRAACQSDVAGIVVLARLVGATSAEEVNT